LFEASSTLVTSKL